MIEVTEQIMLFSKLLEVSWPVVDQLMENHDWEEDINLSRNWIQVNWEFFMEREILGKYKFLMPLSIYSENRITNPDKKPEFVVGIMLPSETEDLKKELVPKNEFLRLYSFLTSTEGGFGYYPPFDVAALIHDQSQKHYEIPLSKLNFYLKRI